MTIHDDEPEHQKSEGAGGARTRRAGTLGVIAWSALVALLALRGTGVITSDAWVSAGGIWLIGAGCLGSPIPALRLTPYLSMVLGCAVGGCAAFLSGLILVGRMRPDTLVAFSLVALVAFSIHAINGSGATLKDRQQRAQIERQRRQIEWVEEYAAQVGAAERDKGRAEGRIEGLEIAHREQIRSIETLKGLEDMPLETVEAWWGAMGREIGMSGDGAARQILRVVPDPDDPADAQSTLGLTPLRGYRLPSRAEIAPPNCRPMRPTGTSRRGPGT